MVKTENRNVALLSIYPKYADAILEGTKSVEFRRSVISNNVSRVVIYSTSPVKKVVGYFEVKALEIRTPKELWKKFNKTAGVGFDDFFKYYQGKNKGCGIVVGKVVKFKNPLGLNDLSPALSPPQSYVYLDWNKIGRVLDPLSHKNNFIGRIFEKFKAPSFLNGFL